MTAQAFQDYYPDHFSHCYGCGRLNEKGLHIKSYWEGDGTVCTFTPEEHHCAIPGMVYGGMIASVIDCHSTGSAAAFAYRDEGRDLASEPPIRFLTASLHVDFLKPTPLGVALTLRSHIKESKGRKVVVATELSAGNEVCARGEVVAVRVPDHLARAAEEIVKGSK
jgi:acyl-coenzyme A thioesterase PaaI-like protein